MELEMIEELKKYVIENDLCNKAIEGFWIAFNNWKMNHPDSYAETFCNIPIDTLNVFVHSIGLRSSEWPDCDYNHVTVSIKVHHNGQGFANYVAWFSLNDGVDDDDFLEII